MKKVLLALSLILTEQLYTQVSYNWARPFSGTSNDEGRSVVTDASGNVYSTGSFAGTVDFDPGPSTFNLLSAGSSFDVYISKLDASGNFLWAKKIGGTGADNSYGIALDNSGNVYVTGNFDGTVDMDPGAPVNNVISAGQTDAFILKLDASGAYVWSKAMGGTDFDGATAIAIDAQGNVIATGGFRGTADFDPGNGTVNFTAAGSDDIFISKLDANGNYVFAKAVGSSGSDWGNAITSYATGQLYVTGVFQNSADFDPGIGTTTLTSAGSFDVFVLSLSVTGSFNWAKSMGGAGSDQGRSISVNASGIVFTCGDFFLTADFDPGAGTYTLTSAGGADIFVSELDGGSGNFLSAMRIGGANADVAHSIITEGPDFYLAGTFQSVVNFNPGGATYTITSGSTLSDGFVTKYNALGNLTWIFQLGNVSNDGCRGMYRDGNGGLYITGWFSNTVDFNPGLATNTLTATALTDAFVLKVSTLSTGISEKSLARSISVYPNPSSSVLNLNTEEVVLSVNIYNALGELVQQETLNSFSVKELLSGMYTLQIKTPKGIYVSRFIKE